MGDGTENEKRPFATFSYFRKSPRTTVNDGTMNENLMRCVSFYFLSFFFLVIRFVVHSMGALILSLVPINKINNSKSIKLFSYFNSINIRSVRRLLWFFLCVIRQILRCEFYAS